MAIGSLGDIYFTVSHRTIRTVSNYQRKVSARYSEHSIVMGKPKLEFTGPALEYLSFDIQLHKMYGVTPDDEFDQLKEYVENGAVVDFILNNTPIGTDQWVIKEAAMTNVLHGKHGETIYCDVAITLGEYINDPPITTKEVNESNDNQSGNQSSSATT